MPLASEIIKNFERNISKLKEHPDKEVDFSDHLRWVDKFEEPRALVALDINYIEGEEFFEVSMKD